MNTKLKLLIDRITMSLGLWLICKRDQTAGRSMKIKSWTGGMVESRLKMRVQIKNERGSIEFDICKINNKCIYDSDGFAYSPNDCTMLSCQFQVGDEVEFQMPRSKTWVPMKINNERQLREVKRSIDGCLEFRHANHDLRPSPDYQ